MDLGTPHHCTIVPPYLLERIAENDADLAEHVRATLATDEAFRTGRRTAGARPVTTDTADTAGSDAKPAAAWVVNTAANGTDLPGTKVRAAGEPASGDDAADQAADGITATLALYADIYQRSSYDAKGAEVVLTVHYDKNYDNAFWNGTQLVFGDGDGKVFGSFTKPIDVLGHEFTHAVTQFSAGLDYQGQSGALNESVSDCFGSCVKQRALQQTAETADWLIGEGIFVAGIKARGLRDMAHPGTAYDDPKLGKDPQVGDMKDYVDTADDNGGVHTNSGIPNRAFQLAAVAIGGDTWEGAGRVWYAALTGGQVTAATDFAGFAAATVAAAGDHAEAVTKAWTTVGVDPSDGSATTTGTGGTGTSSSPQTVTVRRTGGLAGRTVEGSVDLSAGDERATQVRDLVDRISLSEPADGGPPHPDAFSYTFDVDGRSVTLPQQHLSPEQRQLADLILADD